MELFDLNASQWHGSVAYQFGADGSRLRPFLTGGLGVTIFDATDLDGETKLAPTVGAGLKWFPSARFGVRLQGRYVPTFLDDASSDFCDPFGFCQSWLQQLDAARGRRRPLRPRYLGRDEGKGALDEPAHGDRADGVGRHQLGPARKRNAQAADERHDDSTTPTNRKCPASTPRLKNSSAIGM